MINKTFKRMRIHLTLTILIVWCAATLPFLESEAFVFSDDCPAPAPCSCSGPTDHAVIFCNNNQLTTVPQFHLSQLHSKEISVLLNKNNLTFVPNYVFRSLASMSSSSIHLKLDSNMINNIELYAFDGIENAVTILELQNNRFTSIPGAVGRLYNLDYLFVTQNPLKHLGLSVMTGIGQTLKTLYIDLSRFPVWPTELAALKKLEHLTISSIPYTEMNSSNFRGFENSLKTLEIKEAPKLMKIPCVVSQLSNLKSLYLEHADKLGENGSSIFENCTQQSRSLTMFTLENSNLTSFPYVFQNFPFLNSLNLVGNLFEYIEAEKIPSGNRLTKIDIASNNFRRIPSALNKMINLIDLDLTENDIVSVEDVDLAGLSHLQTLLLSDNPLRYISTHAFDNNKQLTTLELANTNLKMIPASVTSLAQLAYFDISGGHITCSCEISYLKNWNIKSLRSFDGECTNTHVNLKTYITTSLKLCP